MMNETPDRKAANDSTTIVKWISSDATIPDEKILVVNETTGRWALNGSMNPVRRILSDTMIPCE
jgi:hypothetical protein